MNETIGGVAWCESFLGRLFTVHFNEMDKSWVLKMLCCLISQYDNDIESTLKILLHYK